MAAAGIMAGFLGAVKIGRLYLSHKHGYVAASTQTQTAATQLWGVINHIATCAVSGNGVKLPAFEQSKVIIVINDGVQPTTIYTKETTGITIGTTAGSTGVSLAANQIAIFFGSVAGRWDVTAATTGSGAGTFTTLTASSTLAVTGLATLSGGLALSAPVTIPGANPSAAGSSVANATQLTAMINDLTVVGSGDGVILPPAVAGTLCIIFNRITSSGHAVQVYGNGTDTVDGIAAGTGVPLTDSATAGMSIFACGKAGAWRSTIGAGLSA